MALLVDVSAAALLLSASDLCRCGRASDRRKLRLAGFLLTQSRKGLLQFARRQEDDNTIGGCVAQMRESIRMGSRVR